MTREHPHMDIAKFWPTNDYRWPDARGLYEGWQTAYDEQGSYQVYRYAMTIRDGDYCNTPIVILTPPIDCTGDPLDDPNCCTECGSVEPCDCFDEDDSASEVTGYDNGPTYW